MLLIKVLLILTGIAMGFSGKRKSYNGYKTYRLVATKNKQLEFLRRIKNNVNIDFWSEPRTLGYDIDVMVPPALQSEFTKQMQYNNISVSVLIDNVARTLKHERQANKKRSHLGWGKISFDRFYRYDDILNYATALSQSYPQLVTKETIGVTHEGRNIVGVKISSGGNGLKPALYLEGGIHAREWIAPALALYIIHQLVENYNENKKLTDEIDWIIVPVTNPDGYEFSHTNDRFWRKNRVPTNSVNCIGVDLNRNFGFHWNEGGASSNPCSDIYMGSAPFSEAESVAHQNYSRINNANQRIKFYMAFHSYGPWYLYPWGYKWELPEDWKDLDLLAKKSAAAITAVAGTEYEIGSSTQLLYVASGGSDDYMKGVEGIKFSYTLELPSGGSSGFDPPSTEILSIVSETFEGLKVVGEFISATYSF